MNIPKTALRGDILNKKMPVQCMVSIVPGTLESFSCGSYCQILNETYLWVNHYRGNKKRRFESTSCSRVNLHLDLVFFLLQKEEMRPHNLCGLFRWKYFMIPRVWIQTLSISFFQPFRSVRVKLHQHLEHKINRTKTPTVSAESRTTQAEEQRVSKRPASLNLYTRSLTSSDSWNALLQPNHSLPPEICWLNNTKLDDNPLKNGGPICITEM